jgi:hypothetical protein
MVNRRSQSGHALLWAIALTAVAGLAGHTIHQLVITRLNAVRGEARTVTLGALADAGLAQTLAGLAHEPGFAGVAERSFGPGLVASKVTRAGNRRLVVRVRASLADRALAVEAEVELAAGGPRVVSWQRLPERVYAPVKARRQP